MYLAVWQDLHRLVPVGVGTEGQVYRRAGGGRRYRRVAAGQVVPYRERGKRLDVSIQREETRRRAGQCRYAAVRGSLGRPLSVRTEGVTAACVVAGPPQQPLA